jgi:hypothetical protein
MHLQMNQKLNCIRDWKSFTCQLVLLKYEEGIFFVSVSVYVAYFILIKLDISCQHFQRDIVRGVEGYIVTGSKQVEIGAPFVPLSITTSVPFYLSSASSFLN